METTELTEREPKTLAEKRYRILMNIETAEELLRQIKEDNEKEAILPNEKLIDTTIRSQFTATVSNPPYQNATNAPVFQHFQEVAKHVSNTTAMIYPARWWYGGNGFKESRDDLLTCGRLSKMLYWSETETRAHLFPEAEIAGGVCIAYIQEHLVPSLELREIVQGAVERFSYPLNTAYYAPVKASNATVAKHISALGYPTLQQRNQIVHNDIGLTNAEIAKFNPKKTTARGKLNPNETRIYANTESGKGSKSAYYTVSSKDIPRATTYRVAIGQSIIENEARNLRLFVFDPETKFGRSAVSLAEFETRAEADNFKAYAETAVFEYLLRTTISARLMHLGNYVPDLQDYTLSNPLFQPDSMLGIGHKFHGLTLNERLIVEFNLHGVGPF